MKIYKQGLTHGGTFHADDVFSTALLKLVCPEFRYSRILNVPEDVGKEVIVYDIGRGKYDHHQEGVDVRPISGIKYAAFGLLWREYGEYFVSHSAARKFDESFVQYMDEHDNTGKQNTMASAISAFNRNWNDPKEFDQDAAFAEAVEFATIYLRKAISSIESMDRASEIVETAYREADQHIFPKIIHLEKFVPWKGVLIKYPDAGFVVYPSLRGGYSAEAIQKSVSDISSRIPFPKEWRGADPSMLPDGITFCHSSGFLCAANTRDLAQKACEKAIRSLKRD